MALSNFPCYRCGACCRQVHLSEQTAFLDRGDNVCLHFDDQSRLCRIYDNRPLVCQIQNYYKAHLADQFSWEEFVKLNLEACHQLEAQLAKKTENNT